MTPNEWRAILADRYGYVTTDPDEIAAKLTDEKADGAISIRRGTALPDEHGHLPGSWTSADVFMETDLDDVETDEAQEFWALTVAAVEGMNCNVRELCQENEQLKTKVEQLRAGLDAHKQIVNGLLPGHLLGRHNETKFDECVMCQLEQARADLAKAAGEFRQARNATRRLTAVLTANAARLDVPFTNADGSPWELHVKPAMYALREALGIRFWQPEAAEHSGTEAGR